MVFQSVKYITDEQSNHRVLSFSKCYHGFFIGSIAYNNFICLNRHLLSLHVCKAPLTHYYSIVYNGELKLVGSKKTNKCVFPSR